jgi:pimeloyl-ACP methyl ester carboxylesterase
MALTRRLRAALLLGLGLGLVAMGGLLSMTGLGQRLLGHGGARFIYEVTTLSAEQLAALTQGGWSAQQVQVQPGVRLRALLRKPTSPDADWLVFFPGNDPTQLEGGRALLTALAEERDLGLFVCAYRGFDSSEGVARLPELERDAVASVSHLTLTEKVAPSRLHLIGFSIGGYLAAYAAAQRHQQGLPPASLTLFAPGYELTMVRPSLLARLARGDDYQMSRFLSEVPGPVLVLQGTADEAFGGPSQGQAVARTLGSRAQYEEFSAVGHTALTHHAPALQRAARFIRESAGATPTPR